MNGKTTITGRYEVCNKTENTTEKNLILYPQVLTDFYNSMFEKTAKTKQTYVYQIQCMLKAYAKSTGNSTRKINISQIDNKFLNAYFTHRRRELVNGKPVSNDIIAVQVTAIRNFFEYCIEQGLVSKNPMDGIKRPPIHKGNKQITYLEYDEIEKVLENIENGTGNIENRKYKNTIYQKKWKNRDLCLIAISLFTGIRVGSLVEINIQNIDFENQILYIIQKGNKEMQIYLPDNLMQYIHRWVKDREELLEKTDEKIDALFITQHKGRYNRMSEKTVGYMLKKNTSNLNKHITPHKLRHTFGTHIYQETGDIYLVANLLGHANIQTTTIYAHQDKRKAKEAVDLFSERISESKNNP